MYRARDASTGVVVVEWLRPAHTHWTRLKGLLGTRNLASGEGLWLKPCRQVHMFAMRYAIDVVFLNGEDRVVRIVHELAPWTISPLVSQAASVIELPAGSVVATGIGEGSRLVFELHSH